MADENVIEVACEELGLGSSLGGERAFATLDGESNLDALWWTEGRYGAGPLRLKFTFAGRALEPELTRFEPACQTTVFRSPEVTVEKRSFVDLAEGGGRTFRIAVTAVSSQARPSALGIAVSFWPAPTAGTGHRREPSERERARRFTCEKHGHGFRLAPLDDPGCQVDLVLPAEPVAWTWESGGELAATLELPLPPSGRAAWDLALGPGGSPGLPTPQALARTREAVEAACPLACHASEPELDGALRWAQVNAFRVRHRFPAGWGFTNDPPGDILVVRDAAWFVAGADWFDPEFSRRMLEVIMDHGVDGDGKAAEFLRMTQVPPGREDYGLKLNDDTPLLLWALGHHAEVTGSEKFAARAYPVAARLGEYLLGQRVSGLVSTRAQGTGVHGITGWRNIIPGYRLDGAVTEVNAEALGALEALCRLAALVGDGAGATRWRAAAKALRAAIREGLYDDASGRYLLARSPEGAPVAERTGDVVFPLVFGAAGPDETRSTLDDLERGPFWTERGIRTVPADDAAYDPAAGAGLVGGSWPNLTLWFAAASAAADPGWAMKALTAVTRVPMGDPPPGGGRVVPGQFPEWFHGRTLESRGMALSPWVGPTVVWALVEGIAGLAPDGVGLRVRHPLPLGHLALSGLRYRGRGRHLVLTPRRAIADVPVAAVPCEVFERGEVCPTLGPGWALRFYRGSEAVTVAGSAKGGRLEVAGGPAEETLELDLGPGELVERWGPVPDRRGPR